MLLIRNTEPIVPSSKTAIAGTVQGALALETQVPCCCSQYACTIFHLTITLVNHPYLWVILRSNKLRACSRPSGSYRTVWSIRNEKRKSDGEGQCPSCCLKYFLFVLYPNGWLMFEENREVTMLLHCGLSLDYFEIKKLVMAWKYPFHPTLWDTSNAFLFMTNDDFQYFSMPFFRVEYLPWPHMVVTA